MKLAVIISGMGYRTEKALLYYSKKLAREHGYELFELNLRKLPKVTERTPEEMRRVFDVAYEQAKEALDDIAFDSYEKVLFISKSIGTIIATVYAKENQLQASQILYTPVEDTFKPLESLEKLPKMIAFTGTDDPWVPLETVQEACKKYEIPLVIIKDGNHSLESGKVEVDLEKLVKVMEITERFIAAEDADQA